MKQMLASVFRGIRYIVALGFMQIAAALAFLLGGASWMKFDSFWAGAVASLSLGDMGITVVSLAGLALVVAARFCYRSARYQGGVEWAIYRQRRNY